MGVPSSAGLQKETIIQRVKYFQQGRLCYIHSIYSSYSPKLFSYSSRFTCQTISISFCNPTHFRAIPAAHPRHQLICLPIFKSFKWNFFETSTFQLFTGIWFGQRLLKVRSRWLNVTKCGFPNSRRTSIKQK